MLLCLVTPDFRGQNETKYNRISFLVLFRLTFEKTTENKSEKTHQKINLKTRNRIISSPHEEIRSIYLRDRREMEVVDQKDEKNKPII